MLLSHITSELALNLQPLEFRNRRRELARQEVVLGQILEKTQPSPDTYTALANLAQELRRYYKADRVVFYRFYPDWSGEFIAESVAAGWNEVIKQQREDPTLTAKERVNYDRCLVKTLGSPPNSEMSDTFLRETQGGSYFQRKQLKQVDDVYAAGFSDCYVASLERYQVRAYMIAPIFDGEQLWGLLGVYQNSSPRRWQDSETILLSMISDRLGSILKQLDYLSQIQSKSEQLTKEAERDRLLSKIVERILQSSEGTTVFQSTVREVRRFLNADRVAVMQFYSDSHYGEGEFVAEDVQPGYTSVLAARVNDHCFGENMAGLYLKGRHWACNDLYQAELPDCHLDLLSRFQVRANLVVPLIQGKKLWGLLCIHQCGDPREWQAAEVDFAKQIANQFSVNFQKVQYTERLRAQSEQIASSAEGERLAAKILDQLRQSSDVDGLLRKTTQEIQQLLKCDRVAVYRFNGEDSGEYVAESISQGIIPLVGVKIQSDLLQETQESWERNQETLVINQVHPELQGDLLQFLEQFETKAYVSVPIFKAGKFWGKLSAYQNSGSRHWEVLEVSMLNQIGKQFGLVLEQVEYVEQLQARSVELVKVVEAERTAAKVLDSILQKSENVESVFRSATKEVRQQLKCDRVAVYRFNPDWSGEFVAEAVGLGWVPLVGPNIDKVWLDTYLQETQGGRYRDNETLAVDDVYKVGHAQCHIDILEQFEAKAYTIVPILTGDKLWGLFAAYQNSGPRHWKEEEVRMLAQIGRQFGVVLRQAEYNEQLQDTSAQLARAIELERAAVKIINSRQSLKMETNFKTTVIEVRQLLRADRVAVFRFEPGSGFDDGEVIAEDVNPGYKSALNVRVHDHCFGEQYAPYYSQGQVQAVADIYSAGLSDCHIDVLSQFQVRANLVVPLLKGEQLWGLLCVHQCSGSRKWEDMEVEFARQIASQLGVALQQTDYVEQLEAKTTLIAKAAARERATARAIDNIRKNSDIETIFRTATQETRKLLNVERVTIYKFRDDYFGDFVVESDPGDWPSLVGSGWEDPYLNEHQGGRFRNNEPLVVDDVYNGGLTDCHVEALEDFGVKSCMVVSIFQGVKLWGLLSAFQHSGSRHWEESEVRVLTQVGNQLGVALQQAEYLKQLQEQSNQISKTVARERATARAIDKIRKATEVDNLFRITTQEIRVQLKCDRAAVYAFEPDWSGKFVAESVAAGWVPLVGPDMETIWEDTYLQETQGGRYRRKENFAVDDIYKVDHSVCHIEYLEQFQVKAYVIAPIFTGDKLWGLLAAYQNSGPRHWEEAEVNFLAQIALQFGVALQQVNYIEQLQTQSLQLIQAADLERGAVNIINNIRQIQNLDKVLQAATHETRQILKADRVGVYRFDPSSNYDVGEFVAEDVLSNYTSALDIKIEDHCFGEKHAEKYRTGAVFAAADIYQVGLLNCHIATLEQFQIRANLVIPLLKDRELWGLLCIYQCSGPRQWQENEIEFAKRIAAQLGIALQQAEYIEQLQGQSAQMAKTAEIQKAVSKILTKLSQCNGINGIYRSVNSEVLQLLKCDRTAIYQFLPDWSGKFVAESVVSGWEPLVGPDIETIWEDTHLQETQGGRYRQRQTLVVDDIYTVGHSKCHVDILEQFQIKAYLTAPIFVGDQLWGVLCAYQNSGVRKWEDAEINAVTQLGQGVGIALQRVEYLEQVQQQSEQLTKLAERESNFISLIDTIGQRIAERLRQSNFNTDSLFRATTQEIRQLLQADRVAVYRFGADWSGEFVIEDFSSEYRSLVGTEAALVSDPVLQETQGGIYRHNEASAVSDISKADNLTFSKELLQEWGAKAYMVAPMFKGDELWGLLVTQQNSQPRNWEKSEINLLMQMARQLGIVLQQAESFERIQKQSQQLKEVAAREKADKQALQQGVVQLLTAVRPALNGDLTVRAPVTEDEVGTVADAYNNTLQSLRGIVKQVQASSRQVTQTSQESDQAIAGLTAQAQQQFESLSQALDQIQSMLNSTEAVAKNAQQVEAAVQQANQTVSQGDTAMNRTVEGILDIRETVAETSKRLKRLSESSQKVSRVVNLIGNFTTQTQLLALNASIEATRAGEYGRGFVVVADEVRSLARQSAEATTEIAQLVQEIQAGTAEVSQVMETGIQQVAQGTNLVNDTRQTLNAIVEATAKISQLVEGITLATQVQTQEFQSVTQTMTEVAGIANQTSAEASEISSSFKELLAMSQELQVSADRFTVD